MIGRWIKRRRERQLREAQERGFEWAAGYATRLHVEWRWPIKAIEADIDARTQTMLDDAESRAFDRGARAGFYAFQRLASRP